MKAIGKYKNSNIKIRGLHFEYTHEDYPILSSDVIRRGEQHKRIISEIIGSKCKAYFPSRLQACLIDNAEIDLQELLPELTVYVWATCDKRIDGNPYGWSELLLIWFQEENADVFQMMAENLKKINWERNARDWAL